jgi:hypothetical protein
MNNLNAIELLIKELCFSKKRKEERILFLERKKTLSEKDSSELEKLMEQVEGIEERLRNYERILLLKLEE